eukprot:scaffold6632_cov102-Cylindrotheca_fusiformis.AAC.2
MRSASDITTCCDYDRFMMMMRRRRGFFSPEVVAVEEEDDVERKQSGMPISRAATPAGCFDWRHQEPLLPSGNKSCLRLPSSPPLHQEAMRQTDALLAGEMRKLTVEEMSRALDDVHCVGEAIVETPEFIQRALVAFGEEARAQSNSIYKIALQQNRTYVEGEAFRLKFLRCNLFEIKSSVSQMLKFLQYKAKYFGIHKLGRDILLSDLTNEDRHLLQSGFLHVQQCKDRGGRNVLWIFNEFLGRCRMDSLVRTHYFVNWSILTSDPELQKRGTVFIYYDTAQPGNNVIHQIKMSEYMEFMGFFTSLPCRYSSRHVCLKTQKDTLMVNTAIVACATRMIPLYTRVRTRIHYGSDMELQYTLQDHGISLKTCPVDKNGAVLQDVAKIWYEKLVKNGMSVPHSNASTKGRGYLSDNHSSISKGGSSDGLLGVRWNDVLLGRGTPVQFRPGNVRFRKFLDEHRDVYDQARRANKRRIVAEVSQRLKANGVRFLKAGRDKQWVECNDGEVKKTIAQQFRSGRKEKRSSIAP